MGTGESLWYSVLLISRYISHQRLGQNHDYLIGPYVIKKHIGGTQYVDFLEITLPHLSEDVPLNVHKNT
jgi:hypothetical protein